MTTSAVSVDRPLQRRAPGRRRRNWMPYLWILPAITLYAVFKLLPMIAGLYLAMLKWDGIAAPEFVGLRNFARIFSDDVIGIALWHNVLYALGTVVGKIVLSLLLALLLNQALHGQRLLPHRPLSAGRHVLCRRRYPLVLVVQHAVWADQRALDQHRPRHARP